MTCGLVTSPTPVSATRQWRSRSRQPAFHLEEIERQALIEALKMSNWVQKDAAELLSISPRVMNYKIKTLGIEPPRRRTAPETVAPVSTRPRRHPTVAASEHRRSGANTTHLSAPPTPARSRAGSLDRRKS